MPEKTPEKKTEFAKRIERLERQAERKKLDVLFVITDINRYYLTGFHASNAVLAIEPGENPVFLTDFRYIEMARKAIPGVRVGMLGVDSVKLTDLAKKRKWRRAGYEGTITTQRFDALKKSTPDIEKWTDSSKLISDLRVVKSRAEQNILRRSVLLADEVYARTIQEVRPGMTEWDLRRILRHWMNKLDAENESFDCIIGAGSNSSQCHHHVTRRPVRRGQPLLIDMGALLESYHSDMTRTVFIGTVSPKMREIYKIVLESQRRAIDALRAGAKAKDIDRAARKVIEDAGYGERFGHGLGHGVGLEIHEAPSLAAKSDDTLKSGMVLTIEPGIYLPGVGGVRIEDIAIIRPNGCEILTTTPKELTILDI